MGADPSQFIAFPLAVMLPKPAPARIRGMADFRAIMPRTSYSAACATVACFQVCSTGSTSLAYSFSPSSAN